MSLRFEWDENKAGANIEKHAVSFPEALTVFMDPLAYTFDDPQHSATERRELIVGHSRRNRLLMVSYTERSEDVIRILSARLVTKKERKRYEEQTTL